MNHALVVGMSDGTGDCLQKLDPGPKVEVWKNFLKRLPRDKVHRDELAADLVNGDDVGMAKPGGRGCFAVEPIDLRLIFQHLDGHRSLEFGIVGLVNNRHPAAADGALDLEARNLQGVFLGARSTTMHRF